MDWGSLAPTALGGLLAVGGGFAGQLWGERRTVERERRAWAREDAHRTFDDRRAAYLDLLGALRRMEDEVHAFMDHDEPLVATTWVLPIQDPLNRVMVFAPAPGREAAQEAYGALFAFEAQVQAALKLPGKPWTYYDENVQPAEVRWIAAYDRLIEVIRRDLRVPATRLPLRGPEEAG